MRFLSIRSRANDIAKQKNKGKRGCKTKEQGQMRLLGTRTRANDVAMYKNNNK